jgi:hypothetical protein
MFDPIRALLASSFSKKGIKAAAADTNCFGDTSMKSTLSEGTNWTSAATRQLIKSSVNFDF